VSDKGGGVATNRLPSGREGGGVRQSILERGRVGKKMGGGGKKKKKNKDTNILSGCAEIITEKKNRDNRGDESIKDANHPRKEGKGGVDHRGRQSQKKSDGHTRRTGECDNFSGRGLGRNHVKLHRFT